MEEFLLSIIEKLLSRFGYTSYASRWYQRGFTHGVNDGDKNVRRTLHELRKLTNILKKDYARVLDENKKLRARFLTSFSQEIRNQVFTKSKWRCEYCGSKKKTLTVDHVIPIIKGGTSDMENLVAACIDCNKRKKDMDVEEFKKTF